MNSEEAEEYLTFNPFNHRSVRLRIPRVGPRQRGKESLSQIMNPYYDTKLNLMVRRLCGVPLHCD